MADANKGSTTRSATTRFVPQGETLKTPDDEPQHPEWDPEPMTPEEEAQLREDANELLERLHRVCRNEEELRYTVEVIRECYGRLARQETPVGFLTRNNETQDRSREPLLVEPTNARQQKGAGG